METTNPNTENNVANNETVKATATFTSNIAGLPIALAGEYAKEPVRIEMEFQSAEVTQEKGTGKTWIMIHVKGLSLPIFRNLLQAKADLSNYIDAEVSQFFTASDFEKAYNKFFRNKSFFASVAAYDKGSLYIVDENSSAYKRKDNPAMLGEELVAESAGVRVNGFLRAVLTDEENDALFEQAIEHARKQAQLINSGAKFAI